MAQFKPGDVVKLKSGGPVMTVAAMTGQGVLCCWFQADQSQPQSHEFVEAVLAPSQAPDDNTLRR